MLVKYNKKAVQQISSTIVLKDRYIPYRATIIGRYYKIIYYLRGSTLRIAAFWDMRMDPRNLKKRI